jgi:hypothetical protein
MTDLTTALARLKELGVEVPGEDAGRYLALTSDIEGEHKVTVVARGIADAAILELCAELVELLEKRPEQVRVTPKRINLELLARAEQAEAELERERQWWFDFIGAWHRMYKHVVDTQAEAELKQQHDEYEEGFKRNRAKQEELKAELAALKARRCETCRHRLRPHQCTRDIAWDNTRGDPMYQHITSYKHITSCSRWAAREEASDE